MKNNLIIFFIFTAVLFSIAFNFTFANGNTLEYPNFLNPNITKTPADFIFGLYNYLLGIAGVLAVIMIVYGGVLYISSAGNEAKLSDAKDIIFNAVFGIILLAGAYIILNTINPNIVKLRNIDAGYSLDQSQDKIVLNYDYFYHDEEARNILISHGIKISSTGNCSSSNNPNCTSLEGIPKVAVNKLIEIKNNCGDCNITITGGTEIGHKEHGEGQPVVDLRFDKNLDRYIYSRINTNSPSLNHKYIGSDGVIYMEESDHWHVRL